MCLFCVTCCPQAIKDKTLDKADIIEATGDAIASFGEVHCLTPRLPLVTISIMEELT